MAGKQNNNNNSSSRSSSITASLQSPKRPREEVPGLMDSGSPRAHFHKAAQRNGASTTFNCVRYSTGNPSITQRNAKRRTSSTTRKRKRSLIYCVDLEKNPNFLRREKVRKRSLIYSVDLEKNPNLLRGECRGGFGGPVRPWGPGSELFGYTVLSIWAQE